MYRAKIRRTPQARHDNIGIRNPSIICSCTDKAYDSEDNHLLVREELYTFSVIPARYEHVPVWRAHGKYRKQMKRGLFQIVVQSEKQG